MIVTSRKLIEVNTVQEECCFDTIILISHHPHTPQPHHRFDFRPLTPPAILPSVLKLDLDFVWPWAGGAAGLVMLAADAGLGCCLSSATDGGLLSLGWSAGAADAPPCSTIPCGRCALRAFSCTLRKRSSRSVQRTPPSSRDLSLLGRSKVETGVAGGWLLGGG